MSNDTDNIVENFSNCEICGSKVTFFRVAFFQPPEGERCDICDKWVCPNCVNHSECLIPPDNHDVVCIECKPKK